MLKKIDERLSRLEEVRKQSQRLLIKLSVSDNNKASKSDIVKMESESVSPEKDVAVKSKTLKELRVAGIMDRFTLDCFKPECTLTELTPDGWRSEMEQAKPELLFIESAWEGKDSLWHGKVNHCSSELCDLTDYCHSNNIPVIFWNKEDPVYTDTFMQTAQRADYVFTTDIECIQKYKTELGHERVYHMHFAAQPCIHNPIEKFERKDKVCFAGAYYHRYADRCKVFDSFADYFIDNRGIDIYDRNYPSPRPEHKFPERYDPYILGKLDPADIDVAYKGYLFGINMNSVIQSQSMFARRVFELMASNTIVIGNYSRGVKNYFGDLTICTDDGKTLKYTLEYYCSSRDSLAKLRLLALRKVLSEHLCEDRLDYIVQKVFGKSLKVKLPSVSVLARVENQEEVIHTLKNFRRQNYNNKKLILVGINIPAESDDVHVMSPEQFDSMKISEIFKSDFITYFAPSDWYGSNYLTDMALTTRYGAFDAIGKASFYASKNNDIIKIGAGEEYHYSNNLVIRRAMLRTGLYEQHYCNELTENLSITTEKAFSIDAINYCENLMGELCPVAEDMILADQGISLDKIDEAAAHIEPAISLTERKVVSAAEISQTLTGNVPVKFEMSENGAVIDSKLQDGVHQYIYMKEFIQIDALCEADKLTVLFKGRGELDLVCGCMFYDEQKMKLEAKYPKLGRKEMIQVPSGAKFLKLMFRPKGKGHAIIEEIILGGGSSESLHGGCFLSRSNMLILTNHYPAPDNLYRNMFVHKRVTSYREQQFVVDVMRMNKYANDGFREFEGINVVEGNSDILSFILSTGKIDTVCVHFLDLDMWTVLKDYLDNIRLIVWSHGADIQPWWRRTFNYKTNDELEQAKSESEKRMALWNEVFDVSETKNIHFVYVSKYFADEVMEDYKRNLPADKYSIIHNMIDTDLFDYKVKNPELRYKILTIKPFSSAKYANDLTTKAICELSKREVFNKLEFAIYGDGEDFDTDNKPLMKFNNVKLFRGFLTQKTISEIHKNYGIFIATTRWDSHGVSRDEAMSSGLVPITNAVSAIPEFTDESCAILAPSDDYIEIANGIEKLCDNPDLFLKMSKNAAERVRNQTSKEHTIIKELKLISSCETINYNNRGGLEINLPRAWCSVPELSTYNVTHQESKHIDTYSVRCHDFTVPLIRHGNYEVKSSNGNKYNVFCSQPDRKPVNISIFGSCVSRDCLRLFPAEAFALKSYIARQSVISAVSKPVQIDMDKIKLESKFQKRSVFSDFTKDTFDILKSDGSDWLILDLIDERFQLVEISGSYATKSSEAVRSGIIPSNAATLSKVKKENEYYVGKHSVREYIECFCKELLKIYAPDHIVIHQVFALDNYYSKAGDIKPYPQDNIAFSRILNELLGYMYCVLRELLPQAHVIDCSTLYHGSEEHQWGLSIVHFEDEYYAEVINQLYNIIL